jgi:Tol biopolymer transport system component
MEMKSKRVTVLFLMVALLGTATVITIQAAQNKNNDRQAEAALQAADNKVLIDGDLQGAVAQYNKVVTQYASSRAIAAKALVHMGEAQEKLRNKEAQKAYERVVNEFKDQPAVVAEAQAHLKALTGGSSPSAVMHKGLTRLVTLTANSETYDMTADGRYLFALGRAHDLLTPSLEEKKLPDCAHNVVASPDGKSVACTAHWRDAASQTGGDELRIAPINASIDAQSKIVLRNAEFSTYIKSFGWSPDGKEILATVQRKDNTWLIARISAADGGLRIIKSLEWREPNKVSLSPDGRYIAYDAPATKESGKRDIFVLAADGSSHAAIIQETSSDDKPVWTPDGNAIVFTSDRAGSPGLWLIQVTEGRSEGNPRLLRSNVDGQQPIGFTRDGAYYFVKSSESKADVFAAAVDLQAGTTSEPKRVGSFSSSSNSGPSYSPDGRKLVYWSQRSTDGDFMSVVVRTLNSGAELVIPTVFGGGGAIAWFPDSQSILFSASDGANSPRSFHRIDLNTQGNLAYPVNGFFPVVSPDRRKIYYMQSAGGGEVRIMAYDLETKLEAELFKGGITLRTSTELVGLMSAHFALSPDGQWLAFALTERRAPTLTDPGAQDLAPPVLVVIPSSGGAVRKLQTPATLGLATVAWAPDGKDILVQRGAGQLFWVPVDGGQPRQIGTDRFPAVSSLRADGKEIAIGMRDAGGRFEPEVWVDPDLLPSNAATRESDAAIAGLYVAPLDPVSGRILAAPVRLSDNKSAGQTCAPTWSPDGKYISFTRQEKNKRTAEWVIRSVGNGTERSLGNRNDGCGVVTGVWFHDNTVLTQSFVTSGNRGQLRRFDINTGRGRQLDVPGYNTANAVSLDDKTLYMTVPDPKTKAISIVAVDLASLEPKRVWTAPIPSDRVPLRLALSPDGLTFALVLGDSKKVHLIRVGVDGSGYRIIYSAEVSPNGSTPSQSGLAWTKDGHSILFMDEGKSEQRLMRISADGGKTEFTGLTIGNTDAIFDLNRDGSQIVFYSPNTPKVSAAR